MTDQTRRVLELVAQGKVTVDEAEELLRALKAAPVKDDAPGTAEAGEESKPRYMRILVHKAGKEGRPDKDVNIRVPLSIVRSGIRLGSVIPGFAKERMNAKLHAHGVDIDLDKIDPAAIESLLKDLGELNFDVDGGDEQVRITCE